MATLQFAALAAGKTFAFAPASDTIHFGAAVHADKLVLKELTGKLQVTYAGKTVYLNATTIDDITTSNFTFADGSQVVAGSTGSDSLSGSAFDDQILGRDGDDAINGGNGDDLMVGGAGDDTYYVDSLQDRVLEVAAGGIDTVTTSVDGYTLARQVENMVLAESATVLSASGNSLGNVITGNSYDNTLSGGGGNDVINGGYGTDDLDGGGGADTIDGGEGADMLAGGLGNDIYVVSESGDSITDTGGGADLVQIAAAHGFDYTLANGVENLDASQAIGSGHTYTGNALRNIMSDSTGDYGNELDGMLGADSLTGNDGDDTLDGGAGVDTMDGGAGDDTFVVDVAGELIKDSSGTDTVRIVGAKVTTYTLGAGLENIDASSAIAPAAGLKLTGNTEDNFIQGSSLKD